MGAQDSAAGVDLQRRQLILIPRVLNLVLIPGITRSAQHRDIERQAAKATLGTVIAVDTSVAATGINACIDVRRLALVFQGVLVGDELIADARTAVARASQPVEATTLL